MGVDNRDSAAIIDGLADVIEQMGGDADYVKQLRYAANDLRNCEPCARQREAFNKDHHIVDVLPPPGVEDQRDAWYEVSRREHRRKIGREVGFLDVE